MTTLPIKDKKIYKGNYKRYDGKRIYVVTEVVDVDTGVEMVLFKDNNRASRNDYHICTKESFCQMVTKKTTIGEKLVDKYTRENHHKTPLRQFDELKEDGFSLTDPEKKQLKEAIGSFFDDERFYRDSDNYYDYAKELCKYYREDTDMITLCNKEKKYIIVKEEYDMINEDCTFVKRCLDTVLKEHKEFFKVRFYDGNSVRSTAQIMGKSKGSIEYAEKKLYAALAKLLEDRDKSDGICRLFKV